MSGLQFSVVHTWFQVGLQTDHCMSRKKALELEINQSLLDLMARDVNYGMDKECAKRLLRIIMESMSFCCFIRTLETFSSSLVYHQQTLLHCLQFQAL